MYARTLARSKTRQPRTLADLIFRSAFKLYKVPLLIPNSRWTSRHLPHSGSTPVVSHARAVNPFSKIIFFIRAQFWQKSRQSLSLLVSSGFLYGFRLNLDLIYGGQHLIDPSDSKRLETEYRYESQNKQAKSDA